MRTNYAGHDGLYERKRAQGEAGWCPPDVTLENARRVLTLLERHPITPHLPTLEVGCGNGQMTLLFAQAGLNMHGVDISAQAIAWARELTTAQGATCTFTVGDVSDLPYPDGTFGLLIDGLCLHCIIGEDRATFLQEAHRVLAPDGTLIVQTMCGEPPDFLRTGFDPATRNHMHPEGFATRHFGTPETILAELEQAGFTVREANVIPAGHGTDETDVLLAVAVRVD